MFPKIGMSQKASHSCTILDNWVFGNFILADEPFAKALQIFKIVFQLTIIYVEN